MNPNEFSKTTSVFVCTDGFVDEYDFNSLKNALSDACTSPLICEKLADVIPVDSTSELPPSIIFSQLRDLRKNARVDPVLQKTTLSDLMRFQVLADAGLFSWQITDVQYSAVCYLMGFIRELITAEDVYFN